MNIANKISTFRILTVPFFIGALVYYSPEKDYLRYVALSVFLLAVISDAIDGYIARKNKQQSAAGLVLDPVGDKMLLVSSFIFLYFIDTGIKFPLWVMLTVVSRDAIIILGIIMIFLVRQKFDIYPTIWGKITTIFQMLSVISVLTQWRFSYFVWSTAILFTAISGVDYIRKGFRILYGPVGDNS